MENEANAVDSFLEGEKTEQTQDFFKNESDNPFPEKEQAEKTEGTEETKEAEAPLPFHKDPKLARFIEKEVNKRMGQKPSEVQTFIKETSGDSDEVLEVLTRIIGNDTPERVAAIKDFRKVLGGMEEKGAQKALSKLQEQQEATRKEEEHAEEELTTGFESVEEEFGVDLSSGTPLAKKTRSEFADFIEKIAPKDGNGEIIAYPDFQESFKLFQSSTKKQAPSSAKARQLASRGMDRSTDTASAPKKSITWDSVDRMFGH